MRLAVIGFAAGIWVLQREARLPDALALVASAIVSLALLACVGRLRSPGNATWTSRCVRPVAQLTAFALAGFLWAGLCAHGRINDRLDPALEGGDLVISGVVAGLPQSLERGVRFAFDVESVSPAGARVPSRILLGWYDGLTREEHQEAAPVRAGERWRLPVRLKRPHGLSNPGGFDYEAWLLERGVRATGTVDLNRRAQPPVRLEPLVVRPAYIVERLREHVRDGFWDALPEHRYAGVLTALAIGEQRAIEPEDWDVFTRTGTNHLMSISGLHVTMVSGLIAALVMFVWRRWQVLALRLPAQKAAAFAGLAAAFGYCLISGFAIPAQRTLYMVGVVALALAFDRLTSASRVLALALAVVLALDPWAVLSAGFWLSFGAVALIFYVGSCRIGRSHWLVQWGAMQWAVTVGLAPLLLVWFGRVSLAAPLANAVAIPVVSGLITPLALAGAVLPTDLPLQLAHLLLVGLMWLLGGLAALDGAVWVQHAPVAWALPVALVGVAWLLTPRGFPSRWMGALLLIPMVSVAPPLLARGAASLTVFDVGQGLSVLVRTRSHAMLYDAGPSWGSGADSGDRVIVPALRALGLRTLDALVISHDDNDHAGGALSVMRATPAALLYSSLASFDPITLSAPYRIPCAEAVNWVWDGVRFEFLYPEMARYADPGESANNLSCVLRLSGPFGSALLSGDLEWRGEATLVQRYGRKLAAQVLIVPHHGSSTSSTPAFVQAVSPRVAVFSVGYRNRFAHPRPEVLARYRAQGSGIVRTDQSGAIDILLDPEHGPIRGQRTALPRYWHGQ